MRLLQTLPRFLIRMASRRVLLGFVSPSQNLAKSLLDYTTDDSLSIGKFNQTKKQAESIAKLDLAWSGDLKSLMRFRFDFHYHYLYH